MQKFKSKKLLAIALAVVLTLSLATTAFAAWPSFQNTNTNNGVIDPVANGIPNTTTYPLNNPSDPTQGTTGPTPITVALENAGGWIGVDAVSVINEGVVYTLHNSGSGANVAATNLVDGTSVWTDEAIVNPNVQSGDAQLSTPYYDVATDTLYVATTASSTIDTASVSLSGGTATGSISIAPAVSTVLVQSDLAGSGVYSVELSGPTLAEPIELVPDTAYSGAYGTYYTYNGEQIPAGTYTITLTATGGTGISYISLGRYDWTLYKLTDLTEEEPTVTQLSTGEGQANTPIGYDATYIYWGVWGGDRSYFQLKKSNNAVVQFTPSKNPYTVDGKDDFYYAGAYSNGTDVYFGGDSGAIYHLLASSFSSMKSAVYVDGYIKDAGKVRSSIAYCNGFIYFTAQGLNTNGYLVKMAVDPGNGELVSPYAWRQLPGNSTSSTPVISSNGYVYVGWYQSDPNTFTTVGGVVGISNTFLNTNTATIQLFDVYGNGANPIVGTAGDPVQSSPIVYSVTTAGVNQADYVYFTTNADHTYDMSPVTNHNAYCWRVGLTNINAPSPGANPTWNPATGGTYALQGFASDGGYLVYGDDSNTLYIFH